jgi:hypothetical protein
MQTEPITLERHRFLPHDMVQRAISGRLTTDDFFALQGKPELMRMAEQFDEISFKTFFNDELTKEEYERAGKLPPIRGGSRENDIHTFLSEFAAAAAGTVNKWRGVPAYRGGAVGGYQWRGFYWLYETAEANVDNTLKLEVAQGVSATFTAIQALGTNAMGLLDTGAILTPFTNINGAASGGAAGAAVTPTVTRVAVATSIRHQAVTAGTGTLPALQIGSYGVFI